MFIFQRIQIEVNLASTLLQILNLKMIFALILIMNMMQLNFSTTLLTGLHVFYLGLFTVFYFNYRNLYKYL
jgi:hypothetical protein